MEREIIIDGGRGSEYAMAYVSICASVCVCLSACVCVCQFVYVCQFHQVPPLHRMAAFNIKRNRNKNIRGHCVSRLQLILALLRYRSGMQPAHVLQHADTHTRLPPTFPHKKLKLRSFVTSSQRHHVHLVDGHGEAGDGDNLCGLVAVSRRRHSEKCC